MSDGETPRRRYAGRGVGALPTGRTRAAVRLPGADAATLLPNPPRAFENVRDQFVAANGRLPGSVPERDQPALTIRDVNAIGNFTSAALRNDLPSIDARDAAVIWDKWRQAVADLKELMRNVEIDAQALIVGVILDHRTWDISYSLATALARPGEVFDRYCPWRSDWATFARLHPEAT